MRWLGVLAIWAYRLLVRPWLRRQCLYAESCSAFAIHALHDHGFVAALPRIRARVRSCRMPRAACFVVDATGQARLLAAVGHDGVAPPASALTMLAAQAEQLAPPQPAAHLERPLRASSNAWS